MKKLLSLLLVMSVVLMCFGSVSLVAFAEDNTVEYNNVTYTKISTSDDFTNLITANPSGDFAVVTDEVSVTSPVASFSGTLIGLDISSGAPDEAMRTIKVNVSSSSGNLGGLFNEIGNTSSSDPAIIKNITLTGSVSSTSTTTIGLGGFVGAVLKGCFVTISDCINNASVSGNKAYVGGIVGNSLLENSTSGTGSITIENCKNLSAITTGSYGGMVAAGIIGRHYSPKNLSINNCENSGTITAPVSKAHAGGIFGAAAKVIVNSCRNTGEISGTYAGGIGGDILNKSSSVISKSFNSGTVSGSTAGGFVGYMENILTIKNSFNIGTVTGSSKSGKIVGNANDKNLTINYCYDASESNCEFYGAGTGTITIKNCYYHAKTTGSESNGLTPLSEDDMKVSGSFKEFDFDTDDKVWVMTKDYDDNSQYYLYPQIIGNLYYPEAPVTPEEPEPEPEPELGTQENPYKITTPEEFTSLITENKGAGKYFKLEKPISLGDKENGISYDPINFEGIFDGNNQTITLYINNTTLTYAGLFGSVHSGSKIMNLTVSGEITTNLNRSYTGGIAGNIDNTDIDNCTNNATIIAIGNDNTTAAGIYADTNGTCNITNCVNNGRIFSSINCGGIAGYINAGTSVYKNCVNNGYIGGIFDGVASNYNGGIVARCNRATIVNCTNNGQVTGYSYAGGILGNKTGNRDVSVTGCVNNGTVKATKSFTEDGNVGGIVAQYADNATGTLTITNCNNFGATFNLNEYVVRPVINTITDKVSISECNYLAYDNTYDDSVDNTTPKTKAEFSNLDLSKLYLVTNNVADNGIYSNEGKNYYVYEGSIINYAADGDEDYTIIDATVGGVSSAVTSKTFSFTVNADTVVSVEFSVPERTVTEPVKFDANLSLSDSLLTEEAVEEIADATRGALFFSKFTVRESDQEYGFAFSKDETVDENDTLKAASKPTAVAVFYGNNDSETDYYMATYIKDKDGNYTFFNPTLFRLNIEFTK